MSFKARLAAAAALSVLAPAAAIAQNSQSVDVITVTAQKREQSVADVPINLTAYGEDRLDILGIEQFDELSDFVPGLEVQEQSPNNPGFVIRGITSDDGASNGEARVAVFQDGVSISKSRGSYVELFDIERVEVAKGPQATLFGRGALIGGINVIQNKVDLDGYTASIEAAIGDYNRLEARGHVNMPITDSFGLRIAGAHKERDGYVGNTLGTPAMNAVDLSAVRLSARYQPNDVFNVDIIANYQHDNPIGGTSFKSGTFAPAGGSIEAWEPAALNTFGGFENNTPLGLDREVYGVTVLADYDINDAWSFSSISGWRAFDSVEIFDPDGFAADLLVIAEDATGRQWSQEARFNYDAGGPVTAFFGAAYQYESGKQRIPLATDEAVAQAFLFGLDPFNPVPVSIVGADLGLDIPLGYYEEEVANFSDTVAFDLFGDITWSLSDRLSLTAGLRYTNETKETSAYGWYTNAPNNVTFSNTLFIPATPNGEKISSGEMEFDDFTWRLAAQYQWSDTIDLWASLARGRRPDVISFDTSDPSLFAIAPAEIVDSYEVGGFWQLGDTNVQASVFYSEYENFQTGRFDPNQASFVTDNAGLATQYGLEAQLDHTFNEIATLFATYAYNFSEFDDEDDQGNAQEFAGNTFRLSPDHAVSVGLLSEFDLPNGGTLSFIPTWTWQSQVFFDNDNDLTDAVQDEVQGDYGIVDMTVRYDAPEGAYFGEVFVDNLLDEEYIIDAGNTGDAFGIATFIAGSPRMVGLRVGASF